MAVYVRDLPIEDRKRRKVRNGGTVISPPVFLYCPRCHSRGSASRGDYFYLDPDTKFRCGEHRPLVDMILAREHTEIIEVDPADPFKEIP